MRTFLKAILVGRCVPAFAVTCIVGVAMSSASSSPNADPGMAGIVPLAEPGTQPSPQPATQLHSADTSWRWRRRRRPRARG